MAKRITGVGKKRTTRSRKTAKRKAVKRARLTKKTKKRRR
jgi:hypothetical protein